VRRTNDRQRNGSGIREVFGVRDFALFWSAAVVSNSASWMQTVAVAVHLWDQTESSTWLGGSGFAMMIPVTVLTPYAGVLADRIPRRVILGVTQSLQMVFAFVFFAVYALDLLTPWRTIGLLFANGIVSGIQMASWQSYVPTLVPRSLLVTAVRLNSVQFQASRALGPLIGALVLGVAGVGAAFLVNAITFVPVVIAVLVARPVQTIAARTDVRVLGAMAEGFRYTWSRTSLRRVVIGAFALSAFGQSLIQLTAAMAAELYGRSSSFSAGLVAAFGAGSVLSGMAMVTLGNRVTPSSTVRVGMVLYVLGVALVPLTGAYSVGAVGMFVCGMAHIPVATTFNTFVQSSVSDAYRGRVVSCYLTGVMLGMPLGAFALGRASDLIGVRPTMAIDAVLMIAVLVLLIVGYAGMRFLDHSLVEDGTEASFTSA
jgi:MFS family permease